MIMKRQLILALLAVLACLGLAACSSSSGTVDGPASEVTADVGDDYLSGDTGQEDAEPPDDVGIESCEPGLYIPAKNGRCYLCNTAGDGIIGAGEQIDDENHCTDDACDPDLGVLHTNNDSPCDDGNPDTALDTCTNGTCLGVDMICTPDQFDQIEQECFKCIDGTKYAAMGVSIDDENPCTDDTCDAQQGVVHANNHAPCDDGDPDTYGDTCNEGQCAGAFQICPPAEFFEMDQTCFKCDDDGLAYAQEGFDIDDDNPCTDDACDPADGVVHTSNEAWCDDEDPDTGNDICVQGECVGTPIVCQAGKFTTDNGVCYLCSPDGAGYEPGSIALDDGNVCTDAVCDPEAGVLITYNSDPCDDENPDTVQDVCLDGECVGIPLVCPAEEFFVQDGKCLLCNEQGTDFSPDGETIDDGDACTDDVCDKDAGVTHQFNTGPCDDNNPETGNDTCLDGQCQGIPIVCSPGEFVTDNDLCQLCADTGFGYQGQGQTIDDGDPCTEDVCDVDLGVVHTDNTADCDDLDPCTTDDKCANGQCSGTPLDCNDGNDCTLDDCQDGQCDNLPNTALPGCCAEPGDCSDGDDCTEDKCVDFSCENPAIPDCGAECQPDGPNETCNDNNDCTDDICENGSCTNVNNQVPCDDSNPDTVNDVCSNGACSGTLIACPAGDYYAQNGLCFLCDGDGVGPVDNGTTIDDANVCTDDDCDAGDGVTHVNNADDCDDNDAGTVNDVCNAGICTGTAVVCPAGDYFADAGLCFLCDGDGTGPLGAGLPISDGNVCTDDECDAGQGVTHVNNSAACDDNNPDTPVDQCVDGECTGTIPVVCPAGDYFDLGGVCYLCNGNGNGTVGNGEVIDDNNVCTGEKCDEGDGVIRYNFDGDPCDDNDPETEGDICINGECTGTFPLCIPWTFVAQDNHCMECNPTGDGFVGDGDVIDDNDPCTTDVCHKDDGYYQWNNNDPCDDNDPATGNDECNDGVCAGEPLVCPPGEWVADGPWWCQLCDDTGTDWANDGVDTDDENDCTKDVCDPQLGVTHTNIEGECWDANDCTEDDTCVNGECTGTPVVCDDKSVCTQDVCDPDVGACIYTPVDNPCDDGVALTPDDTCINGECIGMLDPDGDGIPNYGSGPPCDGPALLVGCVDNCPYRANANQADSNNDGYGDACSGDVRFWMRIKTTQKVVALTLDDGWDNDALDGALDALDQGGANASFFLMGEYVSDGTLYPETLARLNNSGYVMGNHSFSGTVGANQAECAAEIAACEQAFLDAGIPNPRPLYRLPDPDETQPPLWVYPAMLQTGYSEQVLANFDLSDWQQVTPTADAMVQCVLDQVQPGDILSMHIGPEVTVDALPGIIQGLKNLGYSLLTIEQMLAFGEPEYFMDMNQIKTCVSYIQ